MKLIGENSTATVSRMKLSLSSHYYISGPENTEIFKNFQIQRDARKIRRPIHI
jgi:hypothetical protein